MCSFKLISDEVAKVPFHAEWYICEYDDAIYLCPMTTEGSYYMIYKYKKNMDVKTIQLQHTSYVEYSSRVSPNIDKNGILTYGLRNSQIISKYDLKTEVLTHHVFIERFCNMTKHYKTTKYIVTSQYYTMNIYNRLSSDLAHIDQQKSHTICMNGNTRYETQYEDKLYYTYFQKNCLFLDITDFNDGSMKKIKLANHIIAHSNPLVINHTIYIFTSRNFHICYDTKMERLYTRKFAIDINYKSIFTNVTNDKLFVFNPDYKIYEYDIRDDTLFKSADMPAYLDMTIITQDE